jgi:Pvc16 N-terminal domain
MIPAVAQTLASILADRTSLRSTEQIDFNPPNPALIGKAALTVYCYHIQACSPAPFEPPCDRDCHPWLAVHSTALSQPWFELLFLITAWDFTILGEQQLMSEALSALLCQEWVYRDRQSPDAQHHEDILFKVSSTPTVDPIQLWQSLNVPLRPAIYITISVPLPRSPLHRSFQIPQYNQSSVAQ